MKAYSEYAESVKDEPFTDDIRKQLRDKGQIIRWISEGLENGYDDREV